MGVEILLPVVPILPVWESVGFMERTNLTFKPMRLLRHPRGEIQGGRPELHLMSLWRQRGLKVMMMMMMMMMMMVNFCPMRVPMMVRGKNGIKIHPTPMKVAGQSLPAEEQGSELEKHAAMMDAPTLHIGEESASDTGLRRQSAVTKGAPTLLSEEVSVSGTGQRKKHAAAKDALTKYLKEESASGMELRS